MNLIRPPVLIDMVADPICPWCYVGFRGLDWSLMALSFEFSPMVRYRPYRLDPDTPAGGRDRIATLARKFPDAAHRSQVEEALEKAMSDVGLSFSPDTPSRIPDTTDAHRLLRWAHEEAVEHQVLEGLFEAYWIHGEDLSRHEVLATVAENAEMDAEEVTRRLATKQDLGAVKEEAADFRAGGVDSVPTFIVNEQTGFAGALPKAQMLEALQQLARETDMPGTEEDE